MKRTIYFSVCMAALVLMTACKKQSELTVQNVSSLNIVNACVGEPAVFINFTHSPIDYSQDQSMISYQSFLGFGKPSGTIPLTIVTTDDTLHPVIQTSLTLARAGIYSYYLIGQPGNLSTLLLSDTIPAYSDSSSGVRFINLSPDSQPLTMNLQGSSPGQNEFANLSYKQISSFRNYAATGIHSNGYNFEIRDASSGNLFTTFTWNPKVFFCN